MLDASHLLISNMAAVQRDPAALRPCLLSSAIVMSAVWPQCKWADLTACKCHFKGLSCQSHIWLLIVFRIWPSHVGLSWEARLFISLCIEKRFLNFYHSDVSYLCRCLFIWQARNCLSDKGHPPDFQQQEEKANIKHVLTVGHGWGGSAQLVGVTLVEPLL